jgi:hypothetical protein
MMGVTPLYTVENLLKIKKEESPKKEKKRACHKYKMSVRDAQDKRPCCVSVLSLSLLLPANFVRKEDPDEPDFIDLPPSTPIRPNND